MALPRSAPLRHVVVSIGLVSTLVGCVATSDEIDVPEASSAPAATGAVDGGDTELDPGEPAEPVDTEPPAAGPTAASLPPDSVPTTDPAATDPATTAPTTDRPVAQPAPSATSEPATDPFLRIGDEGDGVGIMQLKLRALDYLAPGYTEGVFDRATADALIDFQAQYGLVVDGIFGPETDRSLSAAAASVNPEG